MLATAPAPPPIPPLNGSNLNETSHTSPHQKHPRPHPQPLISQSAHPHPEHLFHPSLRSPSSRNGLTISEQELGQRSIKLPSIKSLLLNGGFTSPDQPETWRTLEPGSD
jgi:hypothetical protein